MGLEALELLVRREIGVGVAEADHEPDGDLVVLLVVEERAAVGARVERPAGGVHDEAGLVVLRLYVPELFQADAVHLRVGALAQLVARLELAAKLAAAAL